MKKVWNVFKHEIRKIVTDKVSSILSVLEISVIVIVIAVISWLVGSDGSTQDYYIFIENDFTLDCMIPTTDGNFISVVGIGTDEAKKNRNNWGYLVDGCLVTLDEKIIYDSSSQKSALVASLCGGLIERLKFQRDFPEASMAYDNVVIIDYNNGQNVRNRIAATIFPMILLPLLYGKVSVNLCESISREKDNGTMARNLMTGNSSSVFVYGKMLMGVFCGMLSVFIYFGTHYLCGKVAVLTGIEGLSFLSGISLSFWQFIGIVIFVMNLCILFAAIATFLCIKAKTFKIASTYNNMVSYAVLLLGLVSALKVGKPSTAEYFVPAYNICLIFRDIFTNNVTDTKLFVTFVSQMAFAGGMAFLTVKSFEKEENWI